MNQAKYRPDFAAGSSPHILRLLIAANSRHHLWCCELRLHAVCLFESWTFRIADPRDLYISCGDNARFVNHAKSGTIRRVSSALDADDLAQRHIAPGDEITKGYREFQLLWWEVI